MLLLTCLLCLILQTEKWHAGAQQQRVECQAPWQSSPPPDTVQAGTAVCPLRGKGGRKDHAGRPEP